MIEYEEDWLACSDPLALLSYLESRSSPRKLRLFACALARRYWTLLRDGRSRSALIAGERLADGEVIDLEELQAGAQQAEYNAPLFLVPAHAATTATLAAFPIEAAQAALTASRQQAVRDAAYAGVPGIDEQDAIAEAGEAEAGVQCQTIRHIFGNPFRPVVVEPGLRHWHDGLIVRMARLVYDNHQVEDMPFLADALEEAGCRNDELLAHCRQPGAHPRGCWALDALLQRG
jgi:hypothetical protein